MTIAAQIWGCIDVFRDKKSYQGGQQVGEHSGDML